MSDGLTIKQAKFVKEYLKDGNATQACIRAGYKKANADVTGPRLLGNVGVAAEIAAARVSRELQAEEKHVATMNDIESRLTDQLFGKAYEAEIESIQKRIARKDKTLESLEKQGASDGLDALTRAQITIKIADMIDSIINDELALKRLHLDQQAESNKAAMHLARLKGALDPKRPTVDDPDVLVDSVLRSIIRSGRNPSDLLKGLGTRAKDVIFTTFPVDREPALIEGSAVSGGHPIDRARRKVVPDGSQA